MYRLPPLRNAARPAALGTLLTCALLLGLGCGAGDQPAPGGGRSGAGRAGATPSSSADGSAGSGGGLDSLARTGPVGEPMINQTADQGRDAPAECASIKQMAEVTRGPVDIVWIIDGSGSMLDELAAVQTNITNFANQIASAGIDHHVVMLAGTDVAGPTPLGADPSHYLYVPANVDSHNALQVLLDLHAQYAPFLRTEAALHFVLVSDDESFLAGPDFLAQMEASAGKKFTFHAIASESVNGAPCVGACGLPLLCGGFAPGLQYYWLADATMGQKISICIADWSMVFGPLQDAVIASAPLPCAYPIPEPPTGESFDQNKVNLEFVGPDGAAPTVFPRTDDEGSCADQAAWFYPPEGPTELRLCPSACELVGAGGSIDIALGCDTVTLL